MQLSMVWCWLARLSHLVNDISNELSNHFHIILSIFVVRLLLNFDTFPFSHCWVTFHTKLFASESWFLGFKVYYQPINFTVLFLQILIPDKFLRFSEFLSHHACRQWAMNAYIYALQNDIEKYLQLLKRGRLRMEVMHILNLAGTVQSFKP